MYLVSDQVNYFLNGNVSGSKYDALIYCTGEAQSTCTSLDAYSGYYLNSGSDSTAKKVIKCTNSGCTTIEVSAADNCSKVGEIKKISNEISLCLKDSGNTADTDLIQIKTSTSESYETLSVDTNVYPDANKGIINIKFAPSKVTMMEDASLPECPTTIPTTGVCVTGATEGEHCIHKSSKKIYQTTGGKCVAIVSTTPAKILYFDNSNSILTTLTDSMHTMYMAYQCTFTYNDAIYVVNSCKFVKGYLITSTLSVNCNGWKGEHCIVSSLTAETCSDGEALLTGKNICFGTSGIDLSTLTKDKLVAFDASGTSSIYGMSKGVIFLKLTSTSALVTSVSDEENKYYFNQLAPGSPIRYDKTNRLWKSESFINTAVSSVYAYIDACDPTSKTVINSVSGNFESEDLSESDDLITSNKYYVLDGTNSKKIIKCTHEDGCSIIDSTANTYYIDPATDTNIIECSSTACTSVAHGEGGNGAVFFVDAGIKGNILKCTDADGCLSIPGSTASGHAYVASTKSIADGKGIITCSDGVCVSADKSSAFSSSDIYYVDGSNPKNLITCNKDASPSKCKSQNTTTKQYVDAIDTTKIIDCSANGCFSTKSKYRIKKIILFNIFDI